MIDNDAILEILKTVNYPGFSRDIVSFGMVSNVELHGDHAHITLAVATTSDSQKEALTQAIQKALAGEEGLAQVDVKIVAPGPKGNGQPAAPGAPIGAPIPAPGQGMSPIPGVKYTIAVASGKGGVGKSTVAVNMAAAISQTGASVGILDLDIYGPSLPMIMGIQEQPLLDKNQKIIPLERHGMRLMSFGFISGNKAPTIWRGPMVAKMTQQFFDDVAWGELDYLILDLPPGTGDVQLTLVQRLALTGAIIVTTPQQLALLDVSKGADMFAKVNTPVIGVVENMAGLALEGIVRDAAGNPVPGAKLEMEGLGEIGAIPVGDDGRFSVTVPVFRAGGGAQESERLDVPLLARIPLVPDMVISSDSGEPFVLTYPDSIAGKAFTALAQAVIDQATG